MTIWNMNKNERLKLRLLILLLLFSVHYTKSQTNPVNTEIWSVEKANEWYKKQGWLVGSNYTPAYAINQLEFWQEGTFNIDEIDKELGWAQNLGMNTMRVYLHDLLHQQDSLGFYKRIDAFLQIAEKRQIKPMFVLFDSCWDPAPKLGQQRNPRPFVHNSGWVQSPGTKALVDTTQHTRLRNYVTGLVKRFANDSRILAWDVWNEPDNGNAASYGKTEPQNKTDLVLLLLEKAFLWVKQANPTQPVTSGVWIGNWESPETLRPVEKLQIAHSDIITFHNYDNAELFEKCIKLLTQYGRPILCTEYMARPNGSTFKSSLPIAKKYNVGMYNWGFVNGKTQTIYPWDSWSKQYTAEPPLWFHDLLKADGKPYIQEEVDLIKKLILNAKGK